MKLLVKIIFFVLAIFYTNISEAKTFVVVEVISETTSSLTLDEGKNNDEFRNVISENDLGITFKSESNLVDYRNLAKCDEATAAKGVTTADGFLFRGFTVKTPVNIPVQRFGNMSLGRPDFWGARIGTSQFANRTFGAIKPAWNPLTQYTTGVIPKGTPIKFGIIGPQGWRYPGGSFQFIVPSRSVINQSSKLIR